MPSPVKLQPTNFTMSNGPSVTTAMWFPLENVQLVSLLSDANIYNRRQAQLELSERQAAIRDSHDAGNQLHTMVLDEKQAMKTRQHALWSIIGSGRVDDDHLLKWLNCASPEIRSWAVRTAGRQGSNSFLVLQKIKSLAHDSDPRVRIQVAIAIPKKAATHNIPDIIEPIIDVRSAGGGEACGFSCC